MVRSVLSSVVTVLVVCFFVALLGCHGGEPSGSAAGYVYVLEEIGGAAVSALPPIIISESSTAPEGYVPAVNALVTIGQMYVETNDLGFYVLWGLPPGTYYLEVDIDDDGVVDIAVEITITGGETTWGDDHDEGGG